MRKIVRAKWFVVHSTKYADACSKYNVFYLARGWSTKFTNLPRHRCLLWLLLQHSRSLARTSQGNCFTKFKFVSNHCSLFSQHLFMFISVIFIGFMYMLESLTLMLMRKGKNIPTLVIKRTDQIARVVFKKLKGLYFLAFQVHNSWTWGCRRP